MDQNERYAQVKVEGIEGLVAIPISWEKPDIPADIQNKWQEIVDLAADILNVPSGLITRLTKDNLEILAASRTAGNPYKSSDHDRLGIGMFCETVAGRREGLVVEDIGRSEYWRDNPHAKLGMRSYMGVPIRWEDGELFGTFCVLDGKTKRYEKKFLRLLERFKDLIETDLKNILLREELEKRLSASELSLREIHHRIKNQFNILTSYISLESRGKSGADFQETLKKIRHRIAALSLIHENLCRSDHLSMPSLDAYLERLCSYILDDFNGKDVEVDFRIDDIGVSMDAEISIGLIVSELMTNSLKHAFSGEGTKRIALRISRRDGKTVELEYRDNGRGLPPDFSAAERGSLGMRILLALARQLNGELRTENADGAVFRFTFSL